MPGGGNTPWHTGPHWEAPGLVSSQREQRENVGKGLSCGSAKRSRRGKVSRLGLASLNNSRAPGPGAAPGCLVPGVIRAGG